MLGILLEGRQGGQGLFPGDQLVQGLLGGLIQGDLDRLFQAAAFDGQGLGDDRLQGGVARPHDLLGIEPGHQLGQEEGGAHLPPSPEAGFFNQGGLDGRRPGPEAEMVGNGPALGVHFALTERMRAWCHARKIPGQNECQVLRRHFGPGESKEGLLGFEVAELQQTVYLLYRTSARLD